MSLVDMPGVDSDQKNRNAARLEAEVRAREHGLGVLQALHLVRARLLARPVVLDEEVAARVEPGNVLLHLRERLRRRRLLGLGVLDLLHPLRGRALLLRDALGVRRAGLLRRGHQVLVVLLGHLLRVLTLRQVGLHIADHHIHERDHPVALAGLLRVRPEGLRRRRRRGVGRGADLGEDRDTRTGDARGRRGLLRVTRIRGASRHRDALLFRQLPALRRLVHRRVVELVQLVLRRLDELNRRRTLRGGLQEHRVLLFALLRRLGHRLVEGLDLGRERLDLARKRGHRGGHLLDRRLEARELVLRLLLLRRALGELLVAEGLLRVVIGLLLAEDFDHTVDLLRDLGEIHGLALERRRHQAQLRRVRAARLHQRHEQALGAHRDGGLGALLQELHAGLNHRRHRLLEQVERVVVVEHLDGLADGRDLLGAHLLALGPVRLLLRALRGEVTDECLRLLGFLLSVLHVVLRLNNLDRNFTRALGLGLDGRSRRRDLRLLRSGELLEARGRRGLVLLRRRQVALHLLEHSLQHARDLSGGLRAFLALEEVHYALALVLVELGSRRHHALHDLLLGCTHLQERAHALLERRDRALHRRDVRGHVRGCCHELLILLRAKARGLLLVLLRRLAGRLVVLELLLQLSLLRLQGFQLRAQLRSLLHTVGVAITIAHELLEGLLLLLTLRLDFLQHLLQERADPTDRIFLLANAKSFR